MDATLKLAPAPELIFGLVAPIGVDLNLVTETLSAVLSVVGYQSSVIRITDLMKATGLSKPLGSTGFIQSYRERIEYANEVRRLLGDSALSALAISAIRERRNQLNKGVNEVARKETPVEAHAYIIRQLKRPEEVRLLRSVYGAQFVLISAFAPQSVRSLRIEEQERQASGGLVSAVQAKTDACELVAQDENEVQDKHGQNVSDAFPLGDVFIDATTKKSVEDTLDRFVQLLFGNNEMTPSRDQYGMYLAKSASLRARPQTS